MKKMKMMPMLMKVLIDGSPLWSRWEQEQGQQPQPQKHYLQCWSL
jgi:hypothetical protein